MSTNTHGWRGPPGPFDSSVISTFRYSLPLVVPALRHSCLPSFPPYPSFPPSFPPSVVPAFRRSPLPYSRLPSFPPYLSFPRKRESKAVRPMPAFLSQRSLDSRFRGNDGWAGITALAGMTGTMRANPENEKALRGPPTGIDDASQRHIMSGNPPDMPKLEM